MVGQTSFFCFGWCRLEDLVSLGSNALPDIGAVGEERGGVVQFDRGGLWQVFRSCQ